MGNYDSPVKESREVLKPVGSVVGPAFREKAAEVSLALSELTDLPEKMPFSLILDDGTSVEIGEDMVTRLFGCFV